MKKAILLLLLISSLNLYAVETTKSSTSLSLLLTKQGNTEFYFSSDSKGESREGTIGLTSSNGVDSASAFFYVNYVINSDILSTDTEGINVLLSFATTSGYQNNGDDYMLIQVDAEDGTDPAGLVYDYEISENLIKENSNENNKMKTVEFDGDERSNMAPLTSADTAADTRQAVLYTKSGNDTTFPIEGRHRVDITINSPVRTNESGENVTAFVTGQYTGYIILSVAKI